MDGQAIDSPAAHEILVQALLHGPALGPDDGSRQLVQTHISSLILAGSTVLKLRKPLRLPFLDFSTSALRRIDCEEELRLNRRTAPALYERVLAIGGSPAAPRLDVAADEAIDWALVMRRFDDALLLDRIARAGQLDAACIEALAREVADFHAALPPSPPEFGAPAQVRRWAIDNLDTLAASPLLAASASRVQDLRDWTEAQFAHHAALIEARHVGGLVREGHGDLHLGNIVLLDGVPRPFDCIEFNPALRHSDIVCDIAFTFMDLLRHGLPGLGWRFASGWAERCGDQAGLALLRFFAVYRALVRAKVALLRAGQADAHALQALERDLQLAERIAGLHEAARRPLLVMTCGLSGSGKSTVAAALVAALGAPRLRSDVERKRLHGLAPQARPTPQQVPALYSEQATRRTFEHLADLARRLLEAGLDVIVDAAFLRRGERDRFRAMAAMVQAEVALVECVAPEAVLRARLLARAAGGRDASDADAAVLERQLQWQEPVAPQERAQRIDTDTDAATLEQRCQALVASWRHPRSMPA